MSPAETAAEREARHAREEAAEGRAEADAQWRAHCEREGVDPDDATDVDHHVNDLLESEEASS